MRPRLSSFVSFAFVASICLLFAASALPALSQEAIIYSFGGSTSDAQIPSSALVADKSGNLYGATAKGGASGCGAVFELSPQANGSWTETVIFGFPKQGSLCTGTPGPSLILDGQGNLYSTALGGAHGAGFVYELSPSSGGWTLTDLYDFHPTYAYRDGYYPYAGVTLDHAGNLYGTTYLGGIGQCYSNDGNVAGSGTTELAPPKGNTSSGCGTVFELSPSSTGAWTEKILYNFRSNSDGAGPWANLTLDASGNLFGTTSGGGLGNSGCVGVYISGCGTVFELIRAHGGWKEQVLYAFTGGADGGLPVAGVVFDKAGNLYGTTPGPFAEYGSVYELSPSSTGTWTETTLSSFVDETFGYGAASSLIIDNAGNLYGTTQYGAGPTGSAQLSSGRIAPPPKPVGPGTIFEITPGQGGTSATNWLHTFAGSPDGLNPGAGMVRGPGGALYGTTTYGGAFGFGAAYKFVP